MSYRYTWHIVTDYLHLYIYGSIRKKQQINNYDITYMSNLKYTDSEYNKKEADIHRYTEQTSGYQWGVWMRERQDKGRGLRDTNY